MAIGVRSFEQTPNPNALRCVVDRRVSEGRRSFGRGGPGDGEADPVAAALLGIEGVEGVMLMDDWLTVLKSPQARWRGIRAEVRRVLAGLE